MWLKWISGTKETLRTQHSSQVESLERALLEETSPVEKLTCKVTDFIAWIRTASKGPTMSSYARKEKAKSGWITAQQFLSDMDES